MRPPTFLPVIKSLIGLSLLWAASTASAQFQVGGNFSAAAADARWALSGAAARTAPAIDPEGAGWLRLTPNQTGSQGRAQYTASNFSALNGLTIAFGYAAWGGGKPGADGVAVYLYDAGQDMAGAGPGGTLGYCNGAGAYMGLALDEYGNFSSPGGGCPGGGPGAVPQALAIRGPTSSGNPFIIQAAAPGGIDDAAAQARPVTRHVQAVLTPKPAGAGYLVSVDWRTGPSGPWTRLVDQADFPYAAPAALRVGVVGSTGGLKNIHEVQYLTVTGNAPDLPVVRQRFEPAQVAAGATSTLVFEFSGSGGKSATLSEPILHRLPAGLAVANPPGLGGDCPGMLNAAPGSTSLVIGAGTVMRAAGCTLSVNVRAAAPGTLTSTLAVGSVQTDRGVNTAPVSAALVVGPARR